jgi:CRISPR-associated protein Csb1
VTADLLGTWATDPGAPVALRLKQRLLPVTAEADEPGIIYPPTYADIGYCIDELSDGTKVALIDSVGSQANRMEPIFKQKFPTGTEQEAVWLVPQIEIVLSPEKPKKSDKKEEKGAEPPHQEKRSLLDLAHRSADAVVQSCPTLKPQFDAAFDALRRRGDAGPLCALAPTSLVFGVWDSRGASGEKRPRIVRAVIRAWNVEVLHAAAQFNSVWKALTEDQKAELEKAKPKGVKLSEKGLKDAPAVFRPKTKTHWLPNGAPNPEARVLGGVLVRDRIEREVTVNLLALRNVQGSGPDETARMRKYLLGLSLLAATHEIDLFLREGCQLRCAATEDDWWAVPRRGPAQRVGLGSPAALSLVRQFALHAAEPFRGSWPEKLEHQFNLAEAKKLLAKKDEDTPDED